MINKYFFGKHLDDEEEIIIVVHKHWLMGVKALFWPSLLFIVVSGLLYFVRQKYALYGIGLADIGIAIWWIRNFYDYFLDAWVVTNKGVIDLEWHGWFHRTSARILYSDVQGIEYEIHGVLGTILGFGELALEKISTGATIEMPYVKNPKKVESIILEAMEHYLHKKNLKDAKTVQNILAEFVASSMQKKSTEKDE